MAQKYTVKKGESALTLGKKFGVPPQTILNQNQIKSLTAGQTIRIPPRNKKGNFGGMIPQTNPFPQTTFSFGTQQPFQFSNQVGMSAPFAPSTPPLSVWPSAAPSLVPYSITDAFSTTTPFLSMGPYSTQITAAPYTPPQSAGSLPAAGIGGKRPPLPFQFSATPFSSVGSQARMNEAYVPPPIQPGYADYGQRVNQGLTAPTNATKPQRPTGIYTGTNSANDQAWRNYWNYQAANPSPKPPPPPKVMTRDEIWNMKANQRRRRMAQEQEQGQEQDMGTVSGNASNMMVNWRING